MEEKSGEFLSISLLLLPDIYPLGGITILKAELTATYIMLGMMEERCTSSVASLEVMRPFDLVVTFALCLALDSMP